MTALGMTALQLRIADFRFVHNSIICNICSQLHHAQQTTRHRILFGIDIQKNFSLSYAWDKEKNCYIQKDGRFLTYTRNCEQKATIGIVKSTLKIPPRHNGIIPVKMKGHTIQGHMAYFVSNQDSKKGRGPNINITNGIHNNKGKTSVKILMSNYTNRHITFNKGDDIGHLEPPIDEMPPFPANPDSPATHSIATERMMVYKVKLDTFKPPLHKLKHSINTKFAELLKEYNSQFAQDETTIATTPLTEMAIDTGTSESVSQKPYPAAVKH